MYKITHELRAVDGLILPKWAKSLAGKTEEIDAVDDYRRLRIAKNVELPRLGGLIVRCTQREFTKAALTRVMGIGDRVDLTLGEEPIRLVTHKDLMDSVSNRPDPVLLDELQGRFGPTINNDTWLLPSRAIQTVV